MFVSALATITFAMLRAPFLTLPAIFVAGFAIGTFAPIPWILGVSAAALFLLVVPLVLFGMTVNDSSNGLGPLIFLGPPVLSVLLLSGIGIAYYMATGQTGIQEALGYLRSLTN